MERKIMVWMELQILAVAVAVVLMVVVLPEYLRLEVQDL
jgi:hypothetical protein